MLAWKSFQKTIRQSPLRFILMLTIFVVFTVLLWPAYIHIVEWQFFHTHYVTLQSMASSASCQIPTPNAFDDSVMRYVVKKDPLKCKFVQPELTYVDYEGVLRLNRSAMAAHRIDENLLDCRYSTFRRKPNDDDHVIYDPRKVLNASEKIINGREFVAVTCSYRDKVVYRNYHAYIPRKSGIRLTDQKGIFKPQVFVLVIESMSRLNMIRHMPKTYSYLNDVMKAETLKGLTKVADNSFPNMIALLTGRKVRMVPQELAGNESAGPYDHWPFIWKNFKKEGYVTALTEDDPGFTILNYLAKGCLRQPTDFYPRPLWLASFQSPLLKMSSEFCLGNIPTYTILFQWIKEFIIKHSRELYFLFSFYIAVTHNNFNNAQYLDGDVRHLLGQLNENGYFRNAVVIVMGDHGNRYGSILTTSIGRIEERMPLFSVSIPSALEERHPHLRTYLKKNSERLTTWLDVHSMLMDIVKSTYEESPPIHVWNTRGYSVWRMEIPINRTCETAGIPENHCVCQTEAIIPPDDPRCLEASDVLVNHLNRLLEVVRPFCAQLSLRKLLQAAVILPRKHIVQKEGYELKMRILVSLAPSDAVVEALMQKTAWSKEFRVVGDVSRLNKYGNQSSCIQHREMRKFCYCKSEIGK
ncbi:uncharacterized protein LOC111639791 [Centruroides sculpturatus]|uniref:uncharacterized protein LOC111639791 n=1 Tax=Centruroides sculpturatus TaxID=218467 RepID=UPI000C6E5F8D|nr:uncharacterized protein LOC111639791 [Centruroides sculpturatus]XP_023241504.1 uncharacterized protein LOC111639791 [Centruroides sculpturatus]